MGDKRNLRPAAIYRRIERRDEPKINFRKIAKICHQSLNKISQTFGHLSLPHWDLLPSYRKEILINRVKDAARLRCRPETFHENWLNSKIDEGWKYGPDYDLERKTDPFIVEYQALPVEQRIMDQVFMAIVTSFVEHDLVS